MYRLIPTCRLNHLFKKQQIVRQSTVAVTNQVAATTGNVKKIVRPKKKDRSPTDLLYTLSATVGRDPTGKEYKFHDDPFLLPTYYSLRESFALSQESGKRTAQWIRNNNAPLFNVGHLFIQQKYNILLKLFICRVTRLCLKLKHSCQRQLLPKKRTLHWTI